MNIIRNENTDPAYNLALEEYVLTRLQGEFIILWRNAGSVILGKNQNALSELDVDFVNENKINVVRRISGGGAVFHDLGNINFSFIEDYTPSAFNNYAKFTDPIVDYLATKGLCAKLSGRNDLLIDDTKISGNAQAVRGNRLLHHGTLLYSADLSKLARALKPKPIKHTGREIKSVLSRVANISTFLNELPSVDIFMEELFSFFEKRETVSIFTLKEEDLKAIETLAEEKYRSFDWNFGETPFFTTEKSKKYSFGVVEITFNVNNGRLENVNFHGDFFGIMDISELEKYINGTKFEKREIEKLLIDIDTNSYIEGMNSELLIKLIFD